jgi:hypothetical protein
MLGRVLLFSPVHTFIHSILFTSFIIIMKKAILYFSVLFIALCAMECEPDPVPVTGVKVTPSSVSMVINTTRQLTAEVEPANVVDNTVTWSTSNAAVATVSATGLVTAKMVGTATITATILEGGYKSTCTVTVTATAIAVTGVTLNKTSMSLAVNGTETLTATVTPSNATNKNVTWSSNNSGVATVSTNGLVTAKVAGTATITVTTQDGGKTAQCTVTVTSGGGGSQTVKLVSTLYDSRFGGATYQYEYDTQNRITKITSGSEVNTVTYPNSSSVSYNMSGTGILTLTLNSSGYVTNWSHLGMTQTYEYEDGYLKKHIAQTAGVTMNYQWNNNGVVSRTHVQGSTTTTYTFAYTTTPNKASNIAPWSVSSFGSWYIPADYWGKRTQSLMSSEVQSNPSSTTTYRYETDSDGFVTKVYSKENSNPESLLFEVTYK